MYIGLSRRTLTLLIVVAYASLGCALPVAEPAPTLTAEVEHHEEHDHDDHEEHDHDHHPEESIPTLTPVALGNGEKLRVVATTTLIGDVLRQVAGDAVEVEVLMPYGADPHSFEPVPADIQLVTSAHALFINGFNLEEQLGTLLANIGDVPVIPVSAGITPLEWDDHDHGHDHDHDEGDPHVWTDPMMVKVWVHNIEHGLSALDPANAALYHENAEAYEEALEALHAWIAEEVAKLPPERRLLVTNHDTFAYFAARYGFEVVGAILPSFSTLAEPSARELAELSEAIRAAGVPAVFAETTVNPRLAEQIAHDAGVEVVRLYTDSLSESDGPAATYLDFMRYNVRTIVAALSR